MATPPTMKYQVRLTIPNKLPIKEAMAPKIVNVIERPKIKVRE